MRIILDESAPQKLRLLIDGSHVVITTWFQGWSGLKNGALLNAAEADPDSQYDGQYVQPYPPRPNDARACCHLPRPETQIPHRH